MDKHFKVIIDDGEKTQEFNLHKLLKKTFFYIIGFIVFIIIFSVATSLYLKHDISILEQKKAALQIAYDALQTKNKHLKNYVEQTQTQIDKLSDSLSEIETIIGLKPLDTDTLQERFDITEQTSQQRAVALRLIPSGSPIHYEGITSKYGYRVHPTLGTREFHKGLDMKAKMGTPVIAPADGIVEWAGYHSSSGYGRLVILQHAYGFKTYYGHLSKVAVRSGTFVKKGDLIAYTGNSGMSSGPHLHYEIRFLQRTLNPLYFITWNQHNYEEIFSKVTKVPWNSLMRAMAGICGQHTQLNNEDTNGTSDTL